MVTQCKFQRHDMTWKNWIANWIQKSHHFFNISFALIFHAERCPCLAARASDPDWKFPEPKRPATPVPAESQLQYLAVLSLECCHIDIVLNVQDIIYILTYDISLMSIAAFLPTSNMCMQYMPLICSFWIKVEIESQRQRGFATWQNTIELNWIDCQIPDAVLWTQRFSMSHVFKRFWNVQPFSESSAHCHLSLEKFQKGEIYDPNTALHWKYVDLAKGGNDSGLGNEAAEKEGFLLSVFQFSDVFIDVVAKFWFLFYCDCLESWISSGDVPPSKWRKLRWALRDHVPHGRYNSKL